MKKSLKTVFILAIILCPMRAMCVSDLIGGTGGTGDNCDPTQCSGYECRTTTTNLQKDGKIIGTKTITNCPPNIPYCCKRPNFSDCQVHYTCTCRDGYKVSTTKSITNPMCNTACTCEEQKLTPCDSGDFGPGKEEKCTHCPPVEEEYMTYDADVTNTHVVPTPKSDKDNNTNIRKCYVSPATGENATDAQYEDATGFFLLNGNCYYDNWQISKI